MLKDLFDAVLPLQHSTTSYVFINSNGTEGVDIINALNGQRFTGTELDSDKAVYQGKTFIKLATFYNEDYIRPIGIDDASPMPSKCENSNAAFESRLSESSPAPLVDEHGGEIEDQPYQKHIDQDAHR